MYEWNQWLGQDVRWYLVGLAVTDFDLLLTGLSTNEVEFDVDMLSTRLCNIIFHRFQCALVITPKVGDVVTQLQILR